MGCGVWDLGFGPSIKVVLGLLGALGFECAQHRRTPRPSVERIRVLYELVGPVCPQGPPKDLELNVGSQMRFQMFVALRGTCRSFRLVLRNRGFGAQIRDIEVSFRLVQRRAP